MFCRFFGKIWINIKDNKNDNRYFIVYKFRIMKFHCGQMWITYISDYGSVERWRNRKTDVNHFANLRNAVYTRVSINISIAENKSVQQHRKWHRLEREYRYDSFSTSHSPVYWSFYGKDLKKIIYSEICRLYVSLKHTSEKRYHAFNHLFFLCNPLVLYCSCSSRSRFIYIGNIYFYYRLHNSHVLESTDFLSLYQCESILMRFERIQKLINEKFEFIPLFFSDSTKFPNIA